MKTIIQKKNEERTALTFHVFIIDKLNEKKCEGKWKKPANRLEFKNRKRVVQKNIFKR